MVQYTKSKNPGFSPEMLWYHLEKYRKGEILQRDRERAFTESIRTRVRCANREGVCEA